jgi:nucleotide-binding universal stress UspA family protein
MHKVLAAIKRSSSSAEALALAIDLASTQRAELILVHVISTLDGGSFDEDDIAVLHEPTDGERAVLNDAASTARDHSVDTTTHLLRGSTAEQIVLAADLHDVDLIVVGSRGHRAIASALLGDVSLNVLRKSNRPVLIVRRRRSPQADVHAQPTSA